MKKINNHVEELFKDIPNNENTEAIKQEILQNLEEKVWDLMQQGKEEEDAINKAIVDFGDIGELRKELDARLPEKKDMTKLNLGFSIAGSVLIISLFIFINFYYTPQTIWFVYPTFMVLWWPLAMYFYWLRKR
ncbi:permease prefix domain 1-containing protein [Bacillus sp. 165]|uniref:permease prefix domain 1-containing protein n=1 Tax=Bacillus sp. 165 TaxID=1529117 RepID=UPI001AD964CC|nr:permease prefix domain 1-containing protein [Bacillus sp. 165]MBO9130723.1 hypothetical protein [Bacillus sp. 165]